MGIHGIKGASDGAIILAASFFYLASPMLVNPLITGFAGTLGVGVAITGLIGGLMNLCSLVVRPLAGNLSDLKNRRALSSVGAGLMALTCGGYALATSPVQVAILRVGNGVGYSLCSVCMFTWFASLLPAERIGSGTGLFGMMNALGMAVGPALGIAVQGAFGYRPALACAGVLAGACVLLVQFVGDSGEPSRSVTGAGPRRSVRLLDVRVVPVALIVTLFTIPYTATQSFIVSYAAARDARLMVSAFFPTYAVSLLALRFLLRRWFDTVGFGRFLVAASISALGSFALLWRLGGNAALLVAAALMAGGYGIMCSACQAGAVRIAGKEHAGLANSTYYMGLDLGMASGPMIGGALIESLGMPALYPALAVCVPMAVTVWLVARRSLFVAQSRRGGRAT